MINSQLSLHYLGLIGAIALGAILRFWNLDLKPLWMDEVITSIFSLGKNYQDLPLDVIFPLERVQEIFTFHPGVSCSQIAHNVNTQSTHPPLFFCAMYGWLSWISPLWTDWVTKLRSLPALLGVATIPAIYWVNRIAFSKSSGVLAAWIMATSPFAIYLSQEARHYTAPMFLITLSLLELMQIQRDIFERSRLRILPWLLWTIINSIGIYIHYFFSLALIAEVFTLILIINQQKIDIAVKQKFWTALTVSISSIILSFLPWLLGIFNHVQRAETSWLPNPTFISPIYQTLINWVLMVVVLPVENQSLSIMLLNGLLMLVFFIWLGQQISQRLHILWKRNTLPLSAKIMLLFTISVISEFLIITYIFNKDITVVPRYNFVYYPSICALLAASLSSKKFDNSKILIAKVLIISIISSIFVVNNLSFQKPFQPDKVARNINLEPDTPLLLVTGYGNYQDVALGLSFILALEPLRNTDQSNASIRKLDNFVFINNQPNLATFRNRLVQLNVPPTSQLNLWIVGPGMRKSEYQPQITLSEQMVCNIDPTQYYRLGIPYQLYRCSKT